MVFLAYSLLIRELDKTNVSDWACVKLTTIGESCRALLRDSIRTMIGWIVEQLDVPMQRGAKQIEQVLRRLGLDGCPVL